MDIYFIIIIILILIIFYIRGEINLKNIEPFCSKKNKKTCLNNFTYSQTLANGNAIIIKNESITPTTITNNGQIEKIMNFQCVPNNYPIGTNATDCNILTNITNSDNARNNDAEDYFPTPTYYLNCQTNGMGTPGCAGGYTAMGLKSYKDFGYTCNIGNGTIPTIVDPITGIITCATDSNGNCLIRSSQTECNTLLNLIPVGPTGTNGVNQLICTSGKVGTPCTNMYNNLQLSTLSDLGYSCNTDIVKNELPGKPINDNSFGFASYDGTNIINNCPLNINFQPINPLKNVICSEYKSNIESEYPTACEQAFTKFNLYPSTNPLVVKGNDPNYTLSGTYNNTSSLFNIYTTYQSAFPAGTDSNSSASLKTGIEEILSETPIKLGCCRRKNPTTNTQINVNVRVPVNPTIESINPFTNKFNFQNSQIVLPENTCPANMYWGSDVCDNFFGLNCNNVMNYMQSENINVESELLNYAPECACYAPQTKDQAGYPSSTPSICYKNGCDLSSNPSVYIDPGSRNGNTVKTCDMTICTSINDFSNMTIGGSATISPQTSNQCGGSAPAPTPPSTPTSTSTSTSTSASTSASTPTSTPTSTSGSNTSGSNTSGSNTSGTSISSNQGTNSESEIGNMTYIIISIVVFVLLLISSVIGYMLMNKKKINKTK